GHKIDRAHSNQQIVSGIGFHTLHVALALCIGSTEREAIDERTSFITRRCENGFGRLGQRQVISARTIEIIAAYNDGVGAAVGRWHGQGSVPIPRIVSDGFSHLCAVWPEKPN